MELLVVADLVENKCNEAPAGYHRVCVDVAGGLVCRVISVSKPTSKMVEHIAFTYSSDPKFANRLWMCTHCDRMDIVQYYLLANRLHWHTMLWWCPQKQYYYHYVLKEYRTNHANVFLYIWGL